MKGCGKVISGGEELMRNLCKYVYSHQPKIENAKRMKWIGQGHKATRRENNKTNSEERYSGPKRTPITE